MADKSTGILQILFFCFSLVNYAAIRMLALFRCASQQREAGLPVEPLGHSFGAFTPWIGFPLSVLPSKIAGSGSSALMNGTMCDEWFVFGFNCSDLPDISADWNGSFGSVYGQKERLSQARIISNRAPAKR